MLNLEIPSQSPTPPKQDKASYNGKFVQIFNKMIEHK